MPTREEMLEAINRLPEDEKRWSCVKKALRPNASGRDIRTAYKRKCPEAKDPDFLAWQRHNNARASMEYWYSLIDDYWKSEDCVSALAITEADKAEFERFKASAESKIAELAEVLEENKEGWMRWEKLTNPYK